MDKREYAASLHKSGYNCCQAVACAFADAMDIRKEDLFRAGEGFGLGMGGMDGTCGALSGAIMLAGLKNSDGDMEAPKTKGSTYGIARAMTESFYQKTGALRCRELKGVDTGKVLCSCPDCIRAGVEVVLEGLDVL